MAQKGLKFEIGEQLDVYTPATRYLGSRWSIASIIEVKQHQIKLNYFTWQSCYDKWFPKDSERLAPLHTHTLPIIKLTAPQYLGDRRYMTSLALHRNFILFVSGKSINKYDINNDKYSVVFECPENLQFSAAAQLSYDLKRELVIITDPSVYKCYQFDMNKHTLSHRKMTAQNKKYIRNAHYDTHQSVIVYNDDHKDSGILHIIQGREHGYYDEQEETYVDRGQVHNNFCPGKIVYAPTKQKLFYFQTHKCFEMDTKMDVLGAKFIESDIVIPTGSHKELSACVARRHVMNIYDTLVVTIELNCGKPITVRSE